MCGIVGAVLTQPGDINSNLLEPLKMLEYRGYDSCGYTADKTTYRTVGEVDKLIEHANYLNAEPERNISVGIAHTRWATHGSVTVKNAHPQVSNGRIAIVHNGVIDNYSSLKEMLKMKGVLFDSETDTEVIAHLIDKYVDDANIEYPLSMAVFAAMEDLKGKFSFLALDKKTNTMVAACHGRPLIIFRNAIGTYLASDVSAFAGMPNGEIYHMNDEIMLIKSTAVLHVRTARGLESSEPFFHPYAPDAPSIVDTFDTFMKAEIYQQPDVSKSTLEKIKIEEVTAQLERILGNADHIRKIKLIGCGTSYHAAQMGAKWLKTVADVDSQAYIASEFSNMQEIDTETSLFVFISQSGETADTLSALERVRTYAPHKTISVCNVEHSELVRLCNYSIITHAGTERSVASTKAFTTQLIALIMLSISMSKITKRGIGSISFLVEDLMNEIKAIPEMISSTIDANIKIASKLGEVLSKQNCKQAIFLARDHLYPIALEGALKLAEIAYIPSLTYFTGELKHGPLALVDKKTPVFCVFSDKEVNLEKMFSSLKQVESRGGKLILISSKEGIARAEAAGVQPFTYLLVPSLNRYETIIQPINSMIPMQLVAHELAVSLGRNVDRPRNLAKSVTVE